MDPDSCMRRREERQERLREIAERVHQELEALLPVLAPGSMPDDQDVQKLQNHLKSLQDAVGMYLVLRVRETTEP